MWIASGLSLVIAIGVHPGAVFVLPALFVYSLWFSGPRPGLTMVATTLGIPVVCYLVWLTCMKIGFPEERNSLLHYPLMTSFEPFDRDRHLIDIVRDLPAEHWRTLAINRVSQFRHYFWTDPLSHSVIDRFRWVSLPNALGWVLLALLLFGKPWRCRAGRAFLCVSILGPLAFHHLYLGQSHAQFHITPVPFFGIGLLAAGALLGNLRSDRESRRFAETLTVLAVLEVFLRHCYPAYVVLTVPDSRGEPPLDILGCFGNDWSSYFALAFLLPLTWTALAHWVCRTNRAE
ncbi:MAG: hypothetical protein CMJ48_14395 [Planctomycetaceae bacterium]|nr:hypothetical protein [Planctomycetaceae bacterium]